MPLLPGQTTLTGLIAQARFRADMVNSQFVTDNEFTTYINASYQELFGLLVQKYGNDYFVAGTPDNWFQFSQTGSNASFPLPDGSSSYTLLDGTTIAPAFFKALGVDLRIYGQSNGWITLKPFQFNDRNRFTYPAAQGAYGLNNRMRYRINGNTVWFSPIPSGGQTFRVWYIPRYPTLSATGTITLASVVIGNTVTINGVTFIASSGTLGINFAVGGTDTITAANLVTVINQQAGSVAAVAGISATSLGPVVTITQSAGSITWSGTSTFSFGVPSIPAGAPNAWTSLVDGVNGWEEYITIDAAIKAMQKEESDCSILGAQKAAIIRRIEAEAENRDAGSPPVVADVRGRYGNGYGVGYGEGDDSDGGGYP